jgi:hypothetical protein
MYEFFTPAAWAPELPMPILDRSQKFMPDLSPFLRCGLWLLACGRGLARQLQVVVRLED